MNASDQLGTAITVEWWKFRRSTVTWTATALMVILMPLMAAAFYSVAINGGNGALAAKAEIFLSAPGWDGFLGMTSQIAAAAALVGVGVVVSWMFGREHAEGAFPSLFALPVGRHVIAAAKIVVLAGWIVALATAVAIGAWLAGSVVVDTGAVAMASVSRVAMVVLLTGVTGISVGLFASAGRGYLPGVGATILLIIAAQVSVLFGTGGWFPPSVPGLIAVQGAPGIPSVSLAQILAVPALAAAAGAATVRWWSRAEAA